MYASKPPGQFSKFARTTAKLLRKTRPFRLNENQKLVDCELDFKFSSIKDPFCFLSRDKLLNENIFVYQVFDLGFIYNVDQMKYDRSMLNLRFYFRLIR